MDELFRKVFNNKFLFIHIFNSNREYIDTSDAKGFSFGNKKKFKDIYQLKWFIENDQYKLLNCKLKAGEEIILDQFSLKNLFNSKSPADHYRIKNKGSFSTRYCSRYRGYYREGDEEIFKTKAMQMFQEESEARKETLSLLINLYPKKLKETCFLIETLLLRSNVVRGIYKPNLELLFIFTSKPFYSSIDKPLLKKILEDNQYKYRDIIVDFIMDHPNMYKPRGKDKLISLKISQFLTIKSTRTQIRLLESGFISLSKKKTIELNNSIGDIGDRVQDLYKQYFEYYKNSRKEKLFEFYNLVNGLKYLADSKFDRNLLSKINQEVKLQKSHLGVSNDFIQLYTKDEFYYRFRNISTDIEIIKYLNKLTHVDNQLYQFAVDSFSFGHGLFKSKDFPKSLWSTLKTLASPLPSQLLIKDKEIIDWILENHQLITEMHQMVYKSTPIVKYQSIELMEYAKEKSSVAKVEFLNSGPVYTYLFSMAINDCNIDQLKYLDCNFNEQIKEFDKIIKSNLSTTDKLIKKSIQEIKKTFVSHLRVAQKKEAKIKFQNQDTSSLIRLVNYLNSTHFKLFSSSLFKEFIHCIVDSNIGEEVMALNQLKINFNQFPSETNQLYTESITDIKSPKIIQLILNNHFNPFSSTSKLESFNEYWLIKSKDKRDGSYYYFYHGYASDGDVYPTNQSCLYFLGDDGERFHCTSGESSSEIIKCINIVLGQFSNAITTAKDDDYLKQLSNTFQNILNYLFKRLIKVYLVSGDTVAYVHQLISRSWEDSTKNSSVKPFKFEHSIYHSYYYLATRSLKTVRLLLSISSTYFINQKTDFDLESINYEDEIEFNTFLEKTPNVLKFLNVNLFTFEFIFNSSISNLLDTLIKKLIVEPSLDSSIQWAFNINPYSENVTLILEFLMEVKEVDLFFKYLDIIQGQLENKEFSIGEFPYTCDESDILDQDCKINNFYQDLKPTFGRYFIFSPKLVQNSLVTLDSDSFFKFCKFCSYLSIKYMSIDYLDQPASGKNLDLLKEILEYLKNK
ncbi:hypothetical protein DICPUDRAFT_151927 [Dictyostelium purpureum]|uniref:Uncharacterized protein n=1 Tax=Dictyostelium purpureum TaxID=5786 RepID=F0ZK37_DICPU|nr:uncharacterized protein DICPUDRAFT_151927 [Dictyostelium purpureum]EGC35691.1 hypothetical protein DICPUDRAFT_151927 [Dictyostelium purpureum]|eukprot:XP_003287791.1 hypothetical protein DICPUDRAFT_151927 [Dictyostelium purpureum]